VAPALHVSGLDGMDACGVLQRCFTAAVNKRVQLWRTTGSPMACITRCNRLQVARHIMLSTVFWN
jgi:hypothetical protein